MPRDARSEREFVFKVVVGATIGLMAEDGRSARAAIDAGLSGSIATLASGPGAGLVLRDMRVTEPAVLLTVDGVDPTSDLRDALDEFRTRSGDG